MTNTAAQDIEAVEAAGYDSVAELDAFTAIQDDVEYLTGPGGTRAASKFEKAVILQAINTPEVTSANAPAMSADEAAWRVSFQRPDGYDAPVFPHPQV